MQLRQCTPTVHNKLNQMKGGAQALFRGGSPGIFTNTHIHLQLTVINWMHAGLGNNSNPCGKWRNNFLAHMISVSPLAGLRPLATVTLNFL